MSSKKHKNEPEVPEQEATPEPEVIETPEIVDVKAEELEKLRAEYAAEHDRYLRLMAEYDNYRKRSSRERENIYADVRADTVLRFLPVYDNLERALAQETSDEAYRRGVEMIMNEFTETLAKLNIHPIEALGTTFDPELHNAVMHEEDETKGEGEIVQEFQKGFRMGDKVIRFSMVKTVN